MVKHLKIWNIENGTPFNKQFGKKLNAALKRWEIGQFQNNINVQNWKVYCEFVQFQYKMFKWKREQIKRIYKIMKSISSK